MKDVIANLKENPKKAVLFVGGPVLLIVIVIVLIVALSGGDSEGDDAVEFVFDDTLPAEPVIPVEEQVRLTVEASIPTPTPEPTADIPATLRAEAEEVIADLRQTPVADPGPTPDPFASVLSPADSRYLNSLGRPVWMATSTHLHLSLLFEKLPQDVLIPANVPTIDRAVTESRRAVTLAEETSAYAEHDVSAPVRSYGVFVEQTVQKVRDAASEARAMFSEIDIEVQAYADLPKARQEAVLEDYYRVRELLDEYARDMERYGCSLCGELYRGG